MNKDICRLQKVQHITVGNRFIHQAHSSLMIATDLKDKVQKKRLCVSENGLHEWIAYDEEVVTLKSDIKRDVDILRNKAMQPIKYLMLNIEKNGKPEH